MTMPWNSEELKRDYIYTSSGHFFDRDTMRFFASRLCEAFKRLSDTEALFITSEKACFDDPRRVYTVRKATLRIDKNGRRKYDISTVGEFARLSRSQALKAFK